MNFENLNLEVLSASYGDSIFLSIKRKEKEFNILVDGGLTSTYYNVRNRRNPNGPLKLLLDDLKTEGRHIDLLIITHIDDDHIGGICKWFQMDFPNNQFVKQIWLNNDIQIEVYNNLNNSVAKAISVVEKLRENNVPYFHNIVKGLELQNEFCIIRVISPRTGYRNIVAKKMALSLNNSAGDDESLYPNIKELINQEWGMSKITDENKASIAFELEVWDKKRLLLLGDADYEDYRDGLINIHKERQGKLEYDIVKLSHHGSKNNFHPDFLKMIHSKFYIVSTDGKTFGHPDKEVLAQIVDKTDSCILFNYESIKDAMFNQQDFIDYHDLDKRIKII